MSRLKEQAAYRVRQGFHALRLISPPPSPASLAGKRLVMLFESLSSRDRRHLVAAYQAALNRTSDPNIQLAALLHDLGKVTLAGKRISLPARIGAVLGEHLPTRIRKYLRSDDGGAWLTGPWLAKHHGRLGANRLRALGVTEAVCWLVEHHDVRDLADERIRILREIDAETL